MGHREEDFSLDVDHALGVIDEHRPSVVLLPSPNNPTGTALPLDTVRAVCAVAPGVVVVDEAYGEFRRTGTPSALELLPTTPNLVVSRTMSKAFALAGARLGYLAASPQICDALRVVRLPYHLSAVTQAVARVALRHADELLARVDELRQRAGRAPSRGCGGRTSRSPTATRTSASSGGSRTGTPSGRACSTAGC